MTQTFSALMRLNRMNKMMRSMERHQEITARAAQKNLTPEMMALKLKEAIGGLLGVPVGDIRTSFEGPDDDDGRAPRGLPGFDLSSIMRKGTKEG